MTTTLRRWLAQQPMMAVTLWGTVWAFSTYFCMYAFRKPFSAGTYEGLTALGGEVELKTAFVVSQLLGYTASKYLGIKICSELKHRSRLGALLGAILFAQASLLLFAVLPNSLKIGAIFLNGLPLGMVWGFVVSYLEGRRTSEIQLAGMSCSFIVASGAVKDVGRWMMTDLGLSEFWMPFATGMIFLVPFAVAAWMLDQMPDPTPEDEAERVHRQPMSGAERVAFVRKFALGLSMLLVAYFGITAFRDFRDNYGIEIFGELGYGETPGIFTRSELWVAFGVLLALMPIYRIRDNRKALTAVFGLLLLGCTLIGASTWMLQQGAISGLTWMILVGLGGYFSYVPFGSVLFDRIVAATRTVGTAVFAIYVADALGYTGSVFLVLFKDLFQADASRLEFFIGFSYFLAAAGSVLFVLSYFDFMRAARPVPSERA